MHCATPSEFKIIFMFAFVLVRLEIKLNGAPILQIKPNPEIETICTKQVVELKVFGWLLYA